MPLARRTALLSALALVAGGAGPASQPVPPAPGPSALDAPELTTTERAALATLRLVATGASGARTPGTGFLFSLFKQGDEHVPAIVASRHLLADAATLEFRLNGTQANGAPDYRNTIPVTVERVSTLRVDHPDPAVDLSILAFDPLMRRVRAAGLAPSVRYMGPELIPTEEALWGLSPVEDVLTIGYPQGTRDGAGAIPIFRRGITATPAYLEYDGARQFLIDAALWPGQDGAPVLLYESGYTDASRPGFVIGSRISLLGVVAGARVQAMDGTLQPAAPGPAAGVPNTLGLCIAADRILEFEPLLAKLGRPVPPGYRMRAAPG